MKRLVLAVGVLALTLFCGNAHAAFVFSNFSVDVGNTFNGFNGYILDPSQTLGMKFTATGGGTLSQINLALGTQGGSTAVTVEFYADNVNTIGALLASGSTTTNGVFRTPYPPSVAAMSATAIVSGADYWVVAKSAGSNAWNLTNLATLGRIAGSGDGGVTYNYVNTIQSAFSVEAAPANAVPEPSSLALLSLGGLAFAARKLRRSKPVVA